MSYALGSTLNLSPAFAADRTLLSTLSLGGAAPSSYGCSSEVSTDGGGSWQAAEQQTLGAGLCGIGLLHAAGTTVLLAYQRPYYLSSGPNRDVVHSLDGGATWTILAPPGDGLALGFQPDLAQRQAVLPDRVLQATERGDLWAYAEFAPCANQPVLGFGQVWVQHRDWQESAGCPLGPERPVQVQASHDAANNFDTYWTSAPDAVCVRVSSDYLGNVHSSVLRVGQDCGGAGDRRLGGALLAFPNGQFWLYVPAGPGQGLVITSQGGVASVSS